MREFSFSANPSPKPAPTHWSNAFSFRRREEIKADKAGKPSLSLGSDILEMLGVKPGDDVIVVVTDVGAVVINKANS